jgi:hypothetical protein
LKLASYLSFFILTPFSYVKKCPLKRGQIMVRLLQSK